MCIFVPKSSSSFQTHRTLMKFSWIPQVKILHSLAPSPLQHLFMPLCFSFISFSPLACTNQLASSKKGAKAFRCL